MATQVLGIAGSLVEGGDVASALGIVLETARGEGAEVRLLAGRELVLPVFDPNATPASAPPEVEALLETLRWADGYVWGSPAYHGAVSGLFKNAIDYVEYLAPDGYLAGKPVGLVAAAGGTLAAPYVLQQMTHIAHALRGWVVPLMVPIHQAFQVFRNGEVSDDAVALRLRQLGRLLVATGPLPG